MTEKTEINKNIRQHAGSGRNSLSGGENIKLNENDAISISIRNVVKKYGNLYAVKDISFDVKKGEFFGFLGPNGAGKTTIIRIITTSTKATSGQVLVNGYDITKEPIKAKKDIGVVSQYINIDMELTCRENLIVHAMLHRMKKKEASERIDFLLDYIEMTDKKNVLVEHISGGMKRKLMIARALLHEPDILFLDEPTIGLDAHSKRKLWELMSKINSENKTIFLTTHYIEEAEELCNRVGIIHEGQLIALDSPANLIKTVGSITLDVLENDMLKSYFFNSREQALAGASKNEGTVVIRETNLEDVFLNKTGRRVES
jgi:ABC-2 type transport system ATP-binding protein